MLMLIHLHADDLNPCIRAVASGCRSPPGVDLAKAQSSGQVDGRQYDRKWLLRWM